MSHESSDTDNRTIGDFKRESAPAREPEAAPKTGTEIMHHLRQKHYFDEVSALEERVAQLEAKVARLKQHLAKYVGGIGRAEQLANEEA